MTSFEFLTVALSFVLGLAVTVLLTAFLAAFRARRTTTVGWLPLTWACYILIIQFDVWWEIYGLVSLEQWTIGAFILLLLISLVLFAAGGLILPSAVGDYPKDLDEYFREDGRWAVALVAVFFVLGSVANPVLWGLPVFGPVNQFNAVGIALMAVTVLGRERVTRASSTLLFGAWLVVYIWVFVPKAY